MGTPSAATKKGTRAKTDFAQKDVPRLRGQLGKYERLCRRLKMAPADVALAWTLRHPSVTSPIIGPRTLAQLEGSVKVLDRGLDEETFKKLDEIFPGPGGPAPEAYAW